MALGYITSARGACHLRATVMKAELSGVIPIDAVEGKAAIYADWEDRFAIRTPDLLPLLPRLHHVAVPRPTSSTPPWATDYTEEELQAWARRIVTESHVFNERRGFGLAQERLPAWVTERPIADKDGKESLTTAAELETMLREYYAVRGWEYPTA